MHGSGAIALFTVLEVDEEWIVAIIEIVDAENPLLSGATVFLGPDSTDIKTVVIGCTIAIALGIIVDPIVDDLIFSAGSREGLSAVEHPGSIKGPSLVQSEHTHDVDVVPTVVVGVIPLATVDAVDAGL